MLCEHDYVNMTMRGSGKTRGAVGKRNTFGEWRSKDGGGGGQLEPKEDYFDSGSD